MSASRPMRSMARPMTWRCPSRPARPKLRSARRRPRCAPSRLRAGHCGPRADGREMQYGRVGRAALPAHHQAGEGERRQRNQHGQHQIKAGARSKRVAEPRLSLRPTLSAAGAASIIRSEITTARPGSGMPAANATLDLRDRDGGNRRLRQWRPRRSHGLRLRTNQSAASGCMTAGTWHSPPQLRFVRSFRMLKPPPHL